VPEDTPLQDRAEASAQLPDTPLDDAPAGDTPADEGLSSTGKTIAAAAESIGQLTSPFASTLADP